MQSRVTKDIVLDALLMAVWRRTPRTGAGLFRSEQSVHKLSAVVFETLRAGGSISRGGNGYDNATRKPSPLLKREWIDEKICGPREEAWNDVL